MTALTFTLGSCGTTAALLALVAAGAASAGETLDRQYGEWRAAAAPLVFQGTELYTYMDGGAEIYLEYGFERLESQSYARGAREIAVEVYRLRDDAYGLLTFLRPRPCGTPPGLGDAACLAGHYLIVAKGPYLCAVTAQSVFPGAHEALLEVARPIASRLEGLGAPPMVLGLLPVKDRLEGSAKQIRGPIGLRSVAPQAADLFSGFSDGAVASFHPDVTGGLLAWASTSLAEDAWRRADARRQRAGAGTESGASEVFDSCDGSRCFAAARLGALVVFAAGEDRLRVSECVVELRTSAARAAGVGDTQGVRSSPSREQER